MKPLFQNTIRSFVNTLVYICSLLRTLFSHNSSTSGDCLILVSHPTDIDLERGTVGKKSNQPAVGGFLPVPPPAGHAGVSTLCRNAIRKGLTEDARRQESLRNSPLFSSNPASVKGNVETCDGVGEVKESASVKFPIRDIEDIWGDDVQSSDTPFDTTKGVKEAHSRPSTTSLPSSATVDVSLKLNGQTNVHCNNNSISLALLGYPLCSTPPKVSNHVKGHRRAAFDTITNITHITRDFPFSEVSFAPGSADDTLVTGKGRSPPLRRKPAFEDLHSPSTPRRNHRYHLRGHPTTPTPKARPSSVVWFRDTMLSSGSVRPLRIVKRNGATSYDAEYSAMDTSIDEDVVSAVRNTFVSLREDNDEGEAARELINRESVWTCKTASTTKSRNNIMATLDQEEETDDEDQYGDESTYRSTCSPPPPYAFANASYAQIRTDLSEAAHLRSLQEKGYPDAKLHPSYSTPMSISTELSYLQDSTSFTSIDSSLDGIITSFEHLIATMGPKFQRPMSLQCSKPVADLRHKPAMKMHQAESTGDRDSPYGGIIEDPQKGEQWSEILLLEAYSA